MDPATSVGFIGGGNMATAIRTVLLSRNIVKAQNMWVSSPTEETRNKWKDVGVSTTSHNTEIANKCNIVILAIKPQMLDVVSGQLSVMNNLEMRPSVLISVLVGVSIATLRQKLPVYQKAIIRALPNTPSMIGEGVTVYCVDKGLERDFIYSEEDDLFKLAEALFSPMGIVKSVPENLMNAYGALSGSGPAYAYLVIEALADGAVKKGVPRATAIQLAAQVLVGAGKMVLKSGKHPGQLKDEVCSPHGTTIAGIHAMERGGVRGKLMDAVEAAANRSEEIEKQD